MRFRWKLLALILTTTLIPILAARALGVRSVRRIGDNLVERVYQNRLQSIQVRMKSSVDAYAAVLESKRALIEAILDAQQQAVISALKTPLRATPALTAGRLWKPSRISEFHAYHHPDGRIQPFHISLDQSVVQIPPKTDVSNPDAIVKRQRSLTPIYQRLYPAVAKVAYWHFTVLAGGIAAYYPGHRQIPSDYDIRQQTWFQGCLSLKSPWSDPFVDPATGQTVVAAVKPISYENGRPTGWTGMVLPINRFLADPLLTQNMFPETMIFLGYLDHHPQTGRLAGRIMAGYSNDPNKPEGWPVSVQGQWLTSTDIGAYHALMADIREGRGGVKRLSYENQDALWVYGALQQDAFLVLVTPYEVIVQPAAQAEAYLNRRFDQIIRMTRYGLLVIILVGAAVAIFFSKTITKPIHALVAATRRLGRGDLETQVAIRTNDEIGFLGREFNRVVPRLKAHYELQRSVALAREVQQNLLPHQTPRLPGLDIAGRSTYCEATGGDYFDFWEPAPPDYECLGIVVGDVSEHGLQSALLMSSVRALLRQRFLMAGDLASKIAAVNRMLCEDVRDSGQFVTLFVAEIDLARRCLHWLRAGHDPGLLYSPVQDTFEALAGPGMALGAMCSASFQAQQCTLEAPAVLVIGTDGIWESKNDQGEMFGKQRLKEIIRANASNSAETLLNEVFAHRRAFTDNLPLEDDVTLTVVKIDPRRLSLPSSQEAGS